MLRLLHTSDWHLGHALHGVARDEEHQAFLRWLLDTIAGEDVDAVIVAGDIFDTANPPVSALKAFFAFIAQARRRFPDLSIVIIGGNHDSPTRLDAPDSLLRQLDVHVVGGLASGTDGATGELDMDRLLVPLRDRSGR